MATDNNSRLNPALWARMIAVVFVALSLLASTAFIPGAPDSQSSLIHSAERDHLAALPDAQLAELGECSELEPEEDDAEHTDAISAKSAVASIIPRCLLKSADVGLIGFAKRSGYHNASGARAPPAA